MRSRHWIAILLTFILAPAGLWAQGQSQDRRPEVSYAVRHDLSLPLRDLPAPARVPGPDRPVLNGLPEPPGLELSRDPLVDNQNGLPDAFASESLVLGVFSGLSADDDGAVLGTRYIPPDTVGDVGAGYYVQMINTIMAIYNKDTGARVWGPAANRTIWSGFGGPCQTENDGDPVVLFDHIAQRWLVTQFALNGDGYQCVAVSQTSDPTGAYYRYAFLVTPGGINDYPKFGVWPDGYYMAVNEFSNAGVYLGAKAVVFERDKMLIGQTARQVSFTTNYSSLQPSDLDGPAPAQGTPNTFVKVNSGNYQILDFAVNWNSPSNSTFTNRGSISTSAFDNSVCGSRACIPQPAGEALDALSGRVMYRVQFRDFGSHKTIVFNHTVDVGSSRAGVRWVELRKTSSNWALYQTGTFAPDSSLHYWMGSAAMDGAGNLAVGYSVSGTSKYPSVRYTSRLDGDPLNVMTGGEVELQTGTGAQLSNSYNRWGDYSNLVVDPADDCTFYYTQEYYANSGAFDYKTVVGKFELAGCGSPDLCGNGTIDAGEVCDGSNLGGATCVSEGFAGGSLSCNAQCTDFDTSGCFGCGDGICNNGEDCTTCAIDCPSGSATTAFCGDGICNAGDGEDCVSCPSDCNGTQSGKPSGRFCCGDGDGVNAVACSSELCSNSIFQCTDVPSGTESFCCGNGTLEPGENCSICPVDASSGDEASLCTDGIDNDCNGDVDCQDAMCSSDPACATPSCIKTADNEKGKRCSDGLDNDCDGLIDAADPDCNR